MNKLSKILLALVIILTRSGLSLDLKKLKKAGLSAILMCFVPACFEIVGVTLFSVILLKFSIFEALLLGSVLAAVSPAIVVPFCIKLKNEGYGNKNGVPDLLLAGSSADDIFVIVLFYVFLGLVSNNSSDQTKFNYLYLLNIPSSFIFGVIFGILFGIIISFIFKFIKENFTLKTCLILGFSFLLLFIETALEKYFSVSSLLAIVIMNLILNIRNKNESKEYEKKFNSLWYFFEIILFVLVGINIDIDLVISFEGFYLILIVILGLLSRSCGVYVCLIKTKFSFKEKIFIIIGYIPKATVQASIGPVALSMGLSCGKLIYTCSLISILISATLGSVLMNALYKKLLVKDIDGSINYSFTFGNMY